MSPSAWRDLDARLRALDPELLPLVYADGPGMLARLLVLAGGADRLLLPAGLAALARRLPGPAGGEISSLPVRLRIFGDPAPWGTAPAAPTGPVRDFLLVPSLPPPPLPADAAGLVFSLPECSEWPGGMFLLRNQADFELLSRLPREGSPDDRGVALEEVARLLLDFWSRPFRRQPIAETERPAWVTAAASAAAWRARVWGLGLPLSWLCEEVRAAFCPDWLLPLPLRPDGQPEDPPFVGPEPWL